MDKIAWLRDLIYLIPVGGLIWKMAQLHAQVKQNTADIAESKNIIQAQNNAIISALNTLTNSINDIKVDVAVLKATQTKNSNIDNNS